MSCIQTDDLYAVFSFAPGDGELVLSDANGTYLNITHCGRRHFGRRIPELFGEFYSSHLRKTAAYCRDGKTAVYFIHDGSSLLWKAAAFISGGRLVCTGRPTVYADKKIICGGNSHRGFIGAFTAVKEYGSYTADYVSPELTERFPLIKSGSHLKKAVSEYLSGTGCRTAMKYCGDTPLPFEFSDILRNAAPVRITVSSFPCAGKTLFAVFSDEKRDTYERALTDIPYCSAYPCGGRLRLADISAGFAQMLGKGLLTSDELRCCVTAAYSAADDPPRPFGYVTDKGIAVFILTPPAPPSETGEKAVITASYPEDIIGKCMLKGAFPTDTEYRAMLLCAEGMTDRAIAHSLGISESFVKKYIASGCRKIGADSRAEMTRRYISR